MKEVREAGITLIIKKESNSSNLLKRDAEDFLKEEVEFIKKKPDVEGDDELMDLIDWSISLFIDWFIYLFNNWLTDMA